MLAHVFAARRKKYLVWWLYLLLAAFPVSARTVFAIAGAPADFPLHGVEVAQRDGILRYYTSDAAQHRESLVVFVPGSGCDGAFRRAPGKSTSVGIEHFAVPYVHSAQLLVLEPPGVPRQYASPEPGLADHCPEAFYRQSDFASTLHAYQRAIDHAMQASPRIKRVLFIGVSDGVTFATALAHRIAETTMLTLISGFGAGHIQQVLHEAISTALAQPSHAAGIQQLQTTMEQWQAILQQPNATTRFMNAHPYTRWSSTALRSASALAADLPQTVTIHLVQGGQDPPALLGFSAGIADLIARKRPFSFSIIPCADHFLVCPQAENPTVHLEETIVTAIDWFLSGKPSDKPSIVHFTP